MRTSFALFLLASAVISTLSGCVTHTEPARSTTTTTEESTTFSRPNVGTVETQTIRSY